MEAVPRAEVDEGGGAGREEGAAGGEDARPAALPLGVLLLPGDPAHRATSGQHQHGCRGSN